MSNPDYLISTPENVDLHLELAGIGNRVYAAVVDNVIMWAAAAALIIIGLGAGISLANIPMAEELRNWLMLSGLGLLMLALLVVGFGYHIYFEGSWQGQTPGKKLAGIRAIEQNGQPITWASAFIRNLVRIVDLFFGIGLLVMLIERHERRLGDLAAGTLVIRERLSAILLEEIETTAQAQDAGMVDIGRVDPRDYDLLVSFLSRRKKMPAAERGKLALLLAQHFKKKLTESTGEDGAEPFLERVYIAYRQRAGDALL